jgi:hypothetical protein
MWKNAIIVVLSITFLFSAFPLHQAMGQPIATASLQLSTTSVLNQDVTFSTNITISNVTDLYGWGVSLYYDSSVLNGTSVDEGPFLKANGVSTYFIVTNFTDHYDSTHGYMYVSCTRLELVAGVNGSGTLATLTFKAVGTGSDVLHFGNSAGAVPLTTELFDSNGNSIPFIDEFPALVILPLFMIATLVSLVAFREWKTSGAKPKQ